VPRAPSSAGADPGGHESAEAECHTALEIGEPRIELPIEASALFCETPVDARFELS